MSLRTPCELLPPRGRAIGSMSCRRATSSQRRIKSEGNEIDVDDLLSSGLPSSRWNKVQRGAVLGHLKRLSFFSKASDEVLEAVLPHIRHVSLTPGEPLFQQGEAPNLFYVVSTGAIQFVRECMDKDGCRVEQVMGSAGPGEIVGELAGFVTRRPRATSAKAASIVGEGTQATTHVLVPWQCRKGQALPPCVHPD